MFAIISDIHGNLEALDAVLKRLEDMSVKAPICLGDLIGYGSDSIACLRMATKWPVVILGDWDESLLDHKPERWISIINEHLTAIRADLSRQPDADSLTEAVRRFKPVHIQASCTFAHGTPRDSREFVFPEDLYNEAKLERIAAQFDKVLFVGHTHIPGLFIRGGDGWSYIEVSAGQEFDVTGTEKVICNVGSVGQPRDSDSRASFVLFDGRTIQFHRTIYDVQTTIAKIGAKTEFDEMNARRLLEGR